MNSIISFLTSLPAENFLRAALLLIGGYFISRLLTKAIMRGFHKKLRPHQAMLIRRIVFLVFFLLFFASVMQELNFHISALLGATGILTVAVGIASQTSMSNLISGIFLIGEKPFEIGDSITLNDISGEIIAIDAMSVRVRTADNAMARIPNEILIKSSFTNLSFFSTRRINLPIRIGCDENINHVMMTLLGLVQKNPLCLPDPIPKVVVESFGDSTVNLQLQVWAPREERADLQSALYKAIKEAFDHEGIAMPYPSRTLYAGDAKKGLAIHLTSPKQKES